MGVSTQKRLVMPKICPSLAPSSALSGLHFASDQLFKKQCNYVLLFSFSLILRDEARSKAVSQFLRSVSRWKYAHMLKVGHDLFGLNFQFRPLFFEAGLGIFEADAGAVP